MSTDQTIDHQTLIGWVLHQDRKDRSFGRDVLLSELRVKTPKFISPRLKADHHDLGGTVGAGATGWLTAFAEASAAALLALARCSVV
jgi:hypothetical protein